MLRAAGLVAAQVVAVGLHYTLAPLWHVAVGISRRGQTVHGGLVAGAYIGGWLAGTEPAVETSFHNQLFVSAS